MSSFINLMASDVWSELDIVNRTESIIASQFPNVEILKRKVTGMMLGQYQLTPDEQAQFGAYAMASFQAGALADAARADMALLHEAMAIEAAQERLAREPVIAVMSEGSEPIVLNQADMEIDVSERAAAEALIAGAPSAPLALVVMRKPPEPTPEPQEPPA